MVIVLIGVGVVALIAVFSYIKRSEEETENKVIKKNLGTMSDYYLDVIEHVTTGYYEEAVNVLRELINKNPDDYPAYLIYSFILRRQGKIEKALSINKTLLATRSLSERGRLAVLKSLLMDYHENGMYKTALKTIEDEGKKLTKDEFVLKLARDMEYNLKEYDKALDYNKRLLDVQKKSNKKELGYVAAAMARDALRKDDLVTAEKLIKQGKSFNRDCERLYYAESILCEKKGEPKAARELMMQVLMIKPSFADRFEDAVLHLYESDLATLVKDMQPVIKKHISNPHVHILMSTIYYRKNLKNEALEELIEAILYEPNSRYILLMMLDLYIEMEQWDKVKEIKDELKTLESERAYICTNCGTIYEKKTWHCIKCDSWGTAVTKL